MTGDPLLRRGVRGLVRTRTGEVLLLRFVDPGDGFALWITPGGAIEEGEALKDALRRELREEIGLESFTAGQRCAQ